MDYTQRLKQTAQEKNSIICLGIDPVLERIPLKGQPRHVIVSFFSQILDAVNDQISTVKSNLAYFEQYDIEGMQALKDVVEYAKQYGLLVIGDAKRGDIGPSSAAYAKALYNVFGFDAVTIAPYMGSDSVKPFIDYCTKGKGQYILCRTSNAGARDLQDVSCNKEQEEPLFMMTAKKIVEWAQSGTGAVVGATYPTELEKLSRLFVDSGKEIPLLIPGVGAQGGSIRDVIAALKKTENDLALHRINSSSGITYAYEKEGLDSTGDWAGAAVREVERMNRKIKS